MILGGAVYGMVEDEELVSAAFLTDSSVKFETLAVVTSESHRRRGHAERCCRRLLKYSFDRGRLPRSVTSERHDAGVALAVKLGFPTRTTITSHFLDIF